MEMCSWLVFVKSKAGLKPPWQKIVEVKALDVATAKLAALLKVPKTKQFRFRTPEMWIVGGVEKIPDDNVRR